MRATCLGLLLLTTGCGQSASTTPRPPLGHAHSDTAPDVPTQPVPVEYQGRGVEEWAADLRSTDPYEAQQAARALAELGEPGLRQLVAGMASESWETRLLSLKALNREHVIQHGQGALAAIVQLLRDSNPAIRQAAIVRVGWYRDLGTSALPQLRVIAQGDADAENRRLAAEVIVGMNDSANSSLALLADPNAEIRRQAAHRLSMMYPPALHALPALERLAESDPSPAVQIAARNAATTIRQMQGKK